MQDRKPLVRPTLTGLTLFRVRGIPLRLHWTLGAMVLYLAWVFSMRFAEMAHKSGPGVLPAYVRNVKLALFQQANQVFMEIKP